MWPFPPRLAARLLFPALFGLAPALVPSVAQATPGVYWTDVALQALTRVDLDGGNPTPIVSSGLASPEGIVVLPDREEIWLALAGTGAILRMTLDGSSADTVLTGLNTPAALAVDVGGGKVYWSSVAIGEIRRANLDGTDVELLLPAGGHVRGIAIDPAAGKLYVSGAENVRILRTNLDGTGVEELVTVPFPIGIALDPAGGKMYWAANGIWRADLDGSDAQQIVPAAPSGVALDLATRKIYWTAFDSPFVARADLDGSNVEPLVEAGPGTPRHLAVVSAGATNAPAASPRAEASRLRLGRPSPNPSSGEVSFAFDAGSAGPLSILVYDAAGRRVRRLHAEASGPAGIAHWNGRSGAGFPVGAGIYFVELRRGAESAVRKIVIRR